jgi:glycosyltransferase involved in cell wall biosynthesis
MNEPKIILSMIVKNEEKIIERCLDAALPVVDGYAIVDTGSIDRTRKRIEAAGKRHNVRGMISADTWKNFGHNRTRCAAAAKAYAKSRGFPLDRTYMLCLDADMVLRPNGFKREELSALGYELKQVCGDMDWWNARLCRLDRDWISVGVTHEFWRAIPEAGELPQLHSMDIDDRDDGGSKSDKAVRDIRLLEEALRGEHGEFDEGLRGRYLFYLAQSYHDVGRFDDAIKTYEKRIEAGGWDEEIWYSQYRIGLCHVKMDREPEAIAALLLAYETRPSRAESLLSLARYLREKRPSATALMAARATARIPMTRDRLFVDRWAYTWGPLEELAILAYYSDDKREGELAAEKLLATHGLSEHQYSQAANNLLFYKSQVLPRVRGGRFEVDAKLRTFERRGGPGETEYLASSASFARLGDKALVNVRLVNYEQQRGRWYEARDPDRKIRTENIVYELDIETMTISKPVLSTTAVMSRPQREVSVLGVEDQRWISHKGEIYFTAVSLEVAGYEDTPQVVIGSGDDPYSFKAVPITWQGAGRCEKNWMPFSDGEHIYVVYACEPFTVLRVDPKTGEALPVVQIKLGTRMARWRGGVGPTRMYDNRLLMLVHEVVHRDNDNVYLHRFVELNGVGGHVLPVRYSEAFTFDHHGIEYGLGMLPHGDNVIVSYGYEDRESRWVEISLRDIKWLEVAP